MFRKCRVDRQSTRHSYSLIEFGELLIVQDLSEIVVLRDLISQVWGLELALLH